MTTLVEVQAPIEHAFRVFTEGIGTWWHPDHHILQAGLAEMVFEPRVGGHIIDRGTDGSECRWSRVLAYEPPDRTVFSWDINLSWQLETDPAKASEIEVTFTPTARHAAALLYPRSMSRKYSARSPGRPPLPRFLPRSTRISKPIASP